MSDKVSEALDQIKAENPTAVLSVGVGEDGHLIIRSSETSVAVLHWLLNKAIFELNIFEANQKTEKEAA